MHFKDKAMLHAVAILTSKCLLRVVSSVLRIAVSYFQAGVDLGKSMSKLSKVNKLAS